MGYLLLIWLMCGVGASLVAVNKGRSAVGWFATGFLLGPVGFIVSLIVSADASGVEARALRSGDLQKCPHCAELVKADATLCRYCGQHLPDIEPVTCPEGVESLHFAAWNGNYATVRRMVDGGVDVNERNSDGFTALDLARLRGDRLISEFLISRGAELGRQVNR